ncbi:MAG TPA: hypothetical protein VE442_25010 [Jatrophihabitans sp.]|nr:hypothetical protein [Jatrophihabitans sp.]
MSLSRTGAVTHDDWTVERPPLALVLATVGAVATVLGYVLFDWAAGTSFADVRHAASADGTTASVVTQAYTRAMFLPLLVVAVLTAFCAPAGHAVSRVVAGGAGILMGLGLIATLIWVYSGAVGTQDTRRSALPPLALLALAGVGIAVLGAAALFDTRAVFARSLAAAIAGLAVILHVYAVADAVDSPAGGAWVAAAGYVLLAVAVAVPYRRITHVR